MAKKKNIHANHRERLRARLLENDARALAPHEILEFLLFTPIRRQNTNETAHLLLDEFGGVRNVLSQPISELVKVDGMGTVSANFLRNIGRAVSSCIASREREQPIIDTPRAAEPYVTSFFRDHPGCSCAFVAMDGFCSFISVRPLDSASSMREIIQTSIFCGANSAIIAYNNGPKPSVDSDVFRAARTALSLINVRLVDMLSVTANGCLTTMPTLDTKYLQPQELEGAVVFHSKLSSVLDDDSVSSYDDLISGDFAFDQQLAFTTDLDDELSPSGSLAASIVSERKLSPFIESVQLLRSAKQRSAVRNATVDSVAASEVFDDSSRIVMSEHPPVPTADLLIDSFLTSIADMETNNMRAVLYEALGKPYPCADEFDEYDDYDDEEEPEDGERPAPVSTPNTPNDPAPTPKASHLSTPAAAPAPTVDTPREQPPAAANSAPTRTRRGVPLSPKLDELIGPHIDPDKLSDEMFEILKEQSKNAE